MSMVSSILAAQAGNVQQIATSIMKSNADAEKFAVQKLLGGQTSQANLGPGVGGNLDISA